ncbi:pentapeptide repeat-containing protein [Actinomadura formosensis]|uniref:pentapeptide repeat-containing protein n=1 Tax=Actinomadura formosensis TaxID=60706 RepID=UPI000AFC103B|nr:pentapeptide repeat-containing protein [Actinomadura formosensis]
MTGSSGIRDRPWEPVVWPANAEAAGVLREWLRDPDETLYAVDQDFRGADLSGADFSEAWLTGSDFSAATLRNAVLYRSHCEDADFQDADLECVDLVKAGIDRANFSGSRMPGANLRRVECMGTSFAQADMRRATLGDAIFIRCDMNGIDLRGSVANMTSFSAVEFTNAKVEGMTGTVMGSLLVHGDDEATELTEVEMERWLRRHGADVSVRD